MLSICGFDEYFGLLICGLSTLHPDCPDHLNLERWLKFASIYNIGSENLDAEIKIYKKTLESDKAKVLFESPKSIVDLLQLIYPHRFFFQQLYALVSIAVVLPVTTAGCERSFSDLKRVKSYLRNSMTQDRLEDAMTLAVCADRVKKLSLDDVVDIFRDSECRRMEL